MRVGAAGGHSRLSAGVRRGRGRGGVGVSVVLEVYLRLLRLSQVGLLGCSQALGGALQLTRTSERMTSRQPNFTLQPWASCHSSLGYGP